MQGLLSRMSVVRQFSVLVGLGFLLTVGGLSLALKRSYDLDFEAKRAEVMHLGEAAATLVNFFIKQAESGALTNHQAKAQALAAFDAIRFDEGNYFFVYDYDGTAVSNARKEVVGTNRLNLAGSKGHTYVRTTVEMSRAGRSGFVDYDLVKTPGQAPVPKVSYLIAAPQWQWVIATGLYVDDVAATLRTGIINLATIFAPLLLGFLLVAFLMRRAVSGVLSSLAAGMRRLAGGDLEAPIMGRGRSDEIGAVAEALVAFRQAALDKMRLEGEAAARRGAAAVDGRRKAEADAAAMAANRQVVDGLGSALARLS